MHDTRTAQVISFPMDRIEQVGRERLARSVAKLQEAAAEQEAAVAAWRFQLGRLGDGVGALGQSLEAYGASLGSARRGVDALTAESRRLEAWADDALTR
ncbi:MAG: hypothetical protein WBQ75_06655 [Acetobacteraceae bacterium]